MQFVPQVSQGVRCARRYQETIKRQKLCTDYFSIRVRLGLSKKKVSHSTPGPGSKT